MAAKPTVGRTVHFYTKNPGQHFDGVGKGPYAALVTRVFPNGHYADLKVFPPHAEPYSVGSAPHQEDVTQHTAWWVWPPRE
jgi:hypothetical protein